MTRSILSDCRRVVAVFLTGLVLAACSASQDVNLAQAAIVSFHDMLSTGQFAQIYSESEASLKGATTAEDMTKLLSAINRKLGPVKSSESDGWNIKYNTSGTAITLRYKTQFERGAGTETFVYRISGGKALLSGYNINSNELIIN